MAAETARACSASITAGPTIWTGRLLRAPEFEGVENWDAGVGVLAVQCWRRSMGTVGICQPRPWRRQPMSATYDAARARDCCGRLSNSTTMRFVERRDYLIECNWKVYVDNYLEGYHLPIAHPGLFREVDYDQYRVETQPLLFESSTRLYGKCSARTKCARRRYVRSGDSRRGCALLLGISLTSC